jgi:hypothetical protein
MEETVDGGAVGVNDTERYLFLALIEAVEDIELLFHSLPLDRAPPISVQVKSGNSYSSSSSRRTGCPER